MPLQDRAAPIGRAKLIGAAIEATGQLANYRPRGAVARVRELGELDDV